MKRCGALKAPAEGLLPPFAKFCPEREVCGAQRAGARLLTRGSTASDPQRQGRAHPRSWHRGPRRRGEAGFWAPRSLLDVHHAAAPAARAGGQ